MLSSVYLNFTKDFLILFSTSNCIYLIYLSDQSVLCDKHQIQVEKIFSTSLLD